MLAGSASSEEDDVYPSILFVFFQRILSVQYSIPDYVHISPECLDLIQRIFIANPATVR